MSINWAKRSDNLIISLCIVLITQTQSLIQTRLLSRLITQIIRYTANRLMFRENGAVKVMNINTGESDIVLTAEQMVSINNNNHFIIKATTTKYATLESPSPRVKCKSVRIRWPRPGINCWCVTMTVRSSDTRSLQNTRSLRILCKPRKFKL